MPEFLVGEVARIRVRALDIDGQTADPGAIALKVKAPAGIVTTYGAPEVVRDAAGIYHADIPLNASGIWAYRWELSAPNAGAAEGVIQVQKSRVI